MLRVAQMIGVAAVGRHRCGVALLVLAEGGIVLEVESRFAAG